MVERSGIGVSNGVVMAEAFVYRHGDIHISHEMAEDREEESAAFEAAYRITHAEYDALEGLNDDEKELLSVYRIMLEDPDYLALIRDNIRKNGYNASWAVEAATDKYVSLLGAVSDDFFKERIADLRDIEGRLLSALSDMRSEIIMPKPSILVADYLYPSEILSMDRSSVLGLCLDNGGVTSHVAILARSLGIPSVFALADLTSLVADGDTIAMDGKAGTVVVNPGRKARSAYRRRVDAELRDEAAMEEGVGLPAVTTDGFRVHLLGNIEGIEGLDSLIRAGAEGIGLFRTEFLMMLPEYEDEEAKASVYREVVERMAPYGPITFRTYDIGGDKSPDGMQVKEDNPILGWRAVRLCMERRDIFRGQLVSILKASSSCHGTRLMFPMVSGSEELRSVIAFLDEVKDECRGKGIAFDENIKIGTMIEIPSAAITSDVIARYVDFMSIGTNDLIQYTIAVDRGNEKISYLYRPLHPAVLRLLAHVAESAHKNGIPVSMCGEMAGYPDYLPILIGLGIDELSMAPSSIMEVRRRIRTLSRSSCASFANHVLSLPDAQEIENALKEFNSTYGKA